MRKIWIGLLVITAATAALPLGCGDVPEPNTGPSSSSSSSSSGMDGSSSSSSGSGMGGGAPATCTDGLKNGAETDVDCGGTCLRCPGDACKVDADCKSMMCTGALCAQINGCDPTNTLDDTGMASVDITFGVGGNSYKPRCIKVKAGAKVTFNGEFQFHPLVAGEVKGGKKVAAAAGSSPLPTNMGGLATGTTSMFVMTPAGAYPYYCDNHGLGGMTGAIFVVP